MKRSRTVFLLSISIVFKNLQTSGLPPVHLLDSHQIRNNNTFLSISTFNVSKRCYTCNMHTCKNIQTQTSLQYVGLCTNTHYNNVYTVEPLTNDHPHQRPSLSYDHISCDGLWFLFVYESLTSDHPSYTTTPM